MPSACASPCRHPIRRRASIKSALRAGEGSLRPTFWAPRLKTGVVKSTLNDGSHQSHRTALPCLKRGPPAVRPPPPTHPSSRSQTWTSLQGTTRSSAASCKSTIGRRYVPLGNLLTTSPHPRIHNEDGHHPPLHTLSMIVIDICTVSSFPEAASQLLPVCSPSSAFLLLHPLLLDEAQEPSHAHTNPRPHFYPSPPWFGTPLSRTGYALRLAAARECE